MNRMADLPFHGFQVNEDSGNLDPARRGPGHGPGKHEDEEDDVGEKRPEGKVGGPEARGRDDGGHGEEAVPEEGFHASIGRADADHDGQGGKDDQGPIEAKLLIGKEALEAFPEEEEVEVKVGAEGDHTDGQDILHQRALEMAYAQGLVGKTAGSCCSKGVDHGVKEVHPGQAEEANQDSGHDQIELIKHESRGLVFGSQLAEFRARDFRLHDIDCPLPHLRGKGKGEDQDPHPPNQVGEGPPEEHGLGQGLDIRQDGGACGGKTRCHLKNRV